MKKSIARPEYLLFCGALRSIRISAGLTQAQLAKKLRKPQTFVSAVERGKIRLDFLQLRDWCRLCKTSLPALNDRFESFVRRWRIDGRKIAAQLEEQASYTDPWTGPPSPKPSSD